MANTYTVKDPTTGKTVRITGDAPPSERELDEIFARVNASSAALTAKDDDYGVLDAAKDVGVGILKGAGDTAATLGSLVHKIPGVSTVVDAVYGTPGLSKASFQEADRVTTPTNIPQSLGKGVEQLAEMFVPASKVATATKGMGLGTRMAAEAANAAGTSVAQGGDATSAAIIGAAVPGMGGVLGTKAATALKESAAKRVAQALGATKERFKAMAAKRAPEIIARGLGGSRASLLKQAQEHASEAGKAIDDVLTGHADSIAPSGGQPVIDALEEAKAAFQTTRRMTVPDAMNSGLLKRPGVIQAGENAVDVPITLDDRPIQQLSKLQDVVRDLGDSPTVGQLVALRKVWDSVVAQAGGFAHRSGSGFGLPLQEQSEAWAKREGATAIRKLLAQDVPDLAAVNKEFSFWKDLKDVLTATQNRTQAQNHRLTQVATVVAGAGAGGTYGDSTGERLKNAAIGAFVTPKVLAGLQSARWKFVDARLRDGLADAIASGSLGRVMSAATRIMAVQTGKATGSREPETPAGATAQP